MKDTNTVQIPTETIEPESTLGLLEDQSADLSHLEEKKRLSTAMSSYYLLYR